MLSKGTIHDTHPTIFINVEQVDIGRNTPITLFDVGGQCNIRQHWRHYYDRTSFLAFVIDGSKPERFQEAKEELHRLDEDSHINDDIPRVILCNKKDLSNFVPASEVSQALGLSELKHHWDVIETSGTKKEHVKEFYDWMDLNFQILFFHS
ncbi:hypothetical protein GEMRC1_005281 [Eukaryota sp. GEM-RC1]